MKQCDLCGAEAKKEAVQCPRCGFEFPREISSDVRNKAILAKHEGKDLEQVKKELNKQQTRMRAYLENMDAKTLRKEELVALLDQSLGYLKVPAILGVEDELVFSQEEESFIKLMFRILEKAEIERGGPIATSGTYIKLANALQSMEEPELARQMIDKALLINPQNSDAQYAKAKLLFYSKDYTAARRTLEKLSDNGKHPKASYLMELIDQISE